MKEAAASGQGYGYDELPGLDYFIRWYVHDMYNLVYELEADSHDEGGRQKPVVIGYNNFGPSMYTRSHERPLLFDGNIVLRPEFRGRRWVSDLSDIRQGIGVDCGVRCFFEETFITNAPATKSLRRCGANVCGTIPRHGYLLGFGFVDGVLFYKSVDESQSFRLRHRIGQSKI